VHFTDAGVETAARLGVRGRDHQAQDGNAGNDSFINHIQEDCTDCFTYHEDILSTHLLSKRVVSHLLLSFKTKPPYVCVVVQSPL
jgi:hypothetical protein